MVAAARDARDARERHLELQARNWLITDLFELGDMPACRAEIARHTRLADELRLPIYQWYAPLWAAVDAMLAGRFADMDALCAEAEQAGMRAGDRNAELFCGMVRFNGQLERCAFDEIDIGFVEDKIAHSPAGPAYRASYAWILAGLGQTARARTELETAMAHPHPFDANWLSAQAECAEACIALHDATHAAVLYDRLLPYAGRPVTAGRASASYGAADRPLGGLAALLGRHEAAVGHLRAAIHRNEELGATAWAHHARRLLEAITERRPRRVSRT